MEKFWWLSLIMCLMFALSTNKKHFLMSLLILEALMVIFLFLFYFTISAVNLYAYLVFITLSACEGALGLSILVNLVRSYSSDYFLMFNTLVYDSV